MYHLCKQTRLYTGVPYSGARSAYVPQSFPSLDEAKEARNKLQKMNPVGWNIYDSETFELVEGVEFHDT